MEYTRHDGSGALTAYLGVDIGGTFTDVVLFDATRGAFTTAKVPTSYRDPITPIVDGKQLLLAEGERAATLNHATTLATNALIEGKLPVGVLLTTKGFRDVLDIGRIQRPVEGIYDFTIDNPPPLIDRLRRIEVVERLDSRGRVVTPLDETALRGSLDALNGTKIDSVAIVFLFSFLDPRHERRAAEIVGEMLPGVPVSLSSEVSPEIREFERSSTTVIDALLKPILSPYLARLDRAMGQEGIDQVRIMMSSGGLTSCDLASSRPVTLVNSGPAAGVLAAANLGRQIGVADLVTIDMGGTSLDIGVVEYGRTAQKYDGSIAGYPLRVPMIDVAAIAAGGGSIAFVDHLDYIQVDRESAGSEPGPACYGRGGERPTITDADLLLGRLSTRLAGRGGFALDQEASERAIDRHVAARLGITTAAAAAGILRVVQARMGKMITANTLEKGIDTRGMPLFVYGGAGPTHGVELAEAMGMRRAIVPYFAGNFSAIGLLLSPVRWESARMVQESVESFGTDRLRALVAELDSDAREHLAAAAADPATVTSRWIAHMRYGGQSFDLAVALPEEPTADELLPALVEAFHVLHERRYAYRSDQETVEIVQLRVVASGPEIDYPAPALRNGTFSSPSKGDGKSQTFRQVYFTGSNAFHDTAIWDRGILPVGAAVAGPALIEGEGSSTLVPPRWVATVDAMLNLDIRLSGGHDA
jgi:N-methylhydantoinase A